MGVGNDQQLQCQALTVEESQHCKMVFSYLPQAATKSAALLGVELWSLTAGREMVPIGDVNLKILAIKRKAVEFNGI